MPHGRLVNRADDCARHDHFNHTGSAAVEDQFSGEGCTAYMAKRIPIAAISSMTPSPQKKVKMNAARNAMMNRLINLSGRTREGFVDCADNGAGDREFDQTAGDPHPKNFRGQRLHGEPDEVAARA